MIINTTEQQALYCDHMGNDLSVVKAAKISFADDETVQAFIYKIDVEGTGGKSHEGLIQYLAKHSHWTPFAHTAITLRMKAPVPIRTQCFKHKAGFVENEESRRYIDSVPEFYIPIFRASVDNKKQGSGEELNIVDQKVEQALYKRSVESSIKDYLDALDRGICEEQARFYLPQGCVVNWYWTGNLASYARFVKQRSDSHAQLEIQELADKVSEIIATLYPVSWEALTQ
jgi:thymidylate synthase (FAD)